LTVAAERASLPCIDSNFSFHEGMFMSEKNLPQSLDAALAKVNPERRRFLGMMLAGAAALPLLTSADLTAAAPPKEIKVPVPPPTFSPAAGTYSTTQTVTISVNLPGVNIFYTTNGSSPTTDGITPTTSSTKYTGPITVSSTKTIKAFGNLNGVSSSVGSATYTITAH
jgi:hypothetical protein